MRTILLPAQDVFPDREWIVRRNEVGKDMRIEGNEVGEVKVVQLYKYEGS